MDKSNVIKFLPIMIFVSFIIVLGSFGNKTIQSPYFFLNNQSLEKVDDWKLNFSESEDMIKQGINVLSRMVSTAYNNNKMAGSLLSNSDSMQENLGFSVGGSKDINNFRENIKQGYLPLTTDITYEGLYYEYYFNTSMKQECTDLFCPSYTKLISKDPISNNTEYYLSVGLNSNIKKQDFQRKKLNLVLVLDISGSMSSRFNRYYYDKKYHAKKQEQDDYEDKSKIEIASKSLVALIDHLNPDDRLAFVVFNRQSYVAKPFRKIKFTDVDALKEHILNLTAHGGTNMEAGLNTATELFDSEILQESDSKDYENRIIFLTDAMPNTGQISESGLFGITKTNSERRIYTTFIGIGVDFNTELIDYITKIKGSNYYSVHSATEFKERMDTNFDYMVSPLVFDLSLDLNSDSYEIEKVYGSPEANETTGQLMKVNTLFLSDSKAGKTKGGIIVIKLKKISDSDTGLDLTVKYEDRNGNKHSNKQHVDFSSADLNTSNTGIRKAVLLARYVNIIKDWIYDERLGNIVYDYSPSVRTDCGISIPEIRPDGVQLGKWERASLKLHVSNHYKEMFKKFKKYFETEAEKLGDENLSKELEILDLLIEN